MISHMFPMVSLDPLGRHLPGGLGCAGPGCAAPQPAPVATFGAADFFTKTKRAIEPKKTARGPSCHRYVYIYIYISVCVLVCNVYIYIHIEIILSLLSLLLVVLILSLLLLQLQLLSLLLLLWVLLFYIYVYMCVFPTSMKGWKASLQDFGGDMM